MKINLKKITSISFLILFLLCFGVNAQNLSDVLKGQILLQVEDVGQAWYVDPQTSKRAYLGRPSDAFRIMRNFGLGISEKDYNTFKNKTSQKLAGRILLRVESLGEAYYTNPKDLKLYYLGKPQDAFQIMKEQSLGISNENLDKISILEGYEDLVENIIENNYPLHKNITATVFWVGEPVGNGSSENNALSSWDDEWQENFGGYDNPFCRDGYYPCWFTPKENPFYVSVPFNDFDDDGQRKLIAYKIVPWSDDRVWTDEISMMKNRWVKIIHNDNTCYGQVEDTGPYQYNDYNYVFDNTKPVNTLANSAGMDVSPALRDCLVFIGLNNALNKINWQFIDYENVPDGPWKEKITTSQINWK